VEVMVWCGEGEVMCLTRVVLNGHVVEVLACCGLCCKRISLPPPPSPNHSHTYARAHTPQMQVRESVLGTEHVLVAKTIVNRANVYFRQGMCMRALADYSRALEIEKRTLGEEHVCLCLSVCLRACVLVFVQFCVRAYEHP
jgi:hypothetical protein